MSSLYRGMSSRSARQRHREHGQDLDRGTLTSPLVMHVVDVHGGVKPNFLAVVDSIEPRALYRVVEEALLIAQQPEGPRNMNRSQEWGMGAEIIPQLLVTGGGQRRGQRQLGRHEPKT